MVPGRRHGGKAFPEVSSASELVQQLPQRLMRKLSQPNIPNQESRLQAITERDHKIGPMTCKQPGSIRLDLPRIVATGPRPPAPPAP